ncbi:MAG TPA: LCP family protein [Candidatus Saccharimonadales bacterium]|nr:LCP family protein [Candidatus Saccharimonadales bacterium]
MNKKSPNIDGIYIPRHKAGQDFASKGAAIPRRAAPVEGASTPKLTLPSPQTENAMPAQLSGLDITLDEPVESKKVRRHKQRRKGWRKVFHKPSRKAVLSTLVAIVVLVLAVGGYFGYIAFHNIDKILQGGGHSAALNGNLAALQHEGDGRVNILVGGYSAGDAAHVDASGGGGQFLTDSMMLVSIDPVNDTADLVSIPRDLWVKLPGCTPLGYGDVENKINAAYECGAGLNDQNPKAGLTYMSKIVSGVTGVNVNYAAVVDYTAFEDLVNAVGGVTVNIQGTDPRGVLDRNFDWVCNYHCYEVKYPNGSVTLNGTQAMYLARARGDTVAPQYAGYGFAQGDFERQQNQRQMLIGIESKAKSVSFLANPVKVTDFLNGLGSNVVTNLDQGDALALARIVKNMPSSKITSVGIPNTLQGSSTPILTSGYQVGASIEEPVAGLFDYSDLQTYLRSKLVDPYIIKEHPTIAIYNGTTVAGLASTEEAILKSYGYNVVSVANAPTQDYTQTVFYDTTHGALPVTKQYLQNRLGVNANYNLPQSFMTTTTTPSAGPGKPAITTTKPPAQYVIILGQDAASQLNVGSVDPSAGGSNSSFGG